jgi:hypothetical protein
MPQGQACINLAQEIQMHRSIIQLAVLFSAALPLASSAADTALTVSDAYVRLAPPGARASAAFLVVRNVSGSDRKLVKAESAVAKNAELHNHINENGVMKMRQVPSIDVKANALAELKPGSYHIMLIDMKKALNEGDSVAITLSFDDGSKQLIEAPVRKEQSARPADKNMDHGGMKH